MRSSSAFFRVFPPPSFMLMPYAGLDISDDGMRCLAYSGLGGSRRVSVHGSEALPAGLFDGGDLKDEKELVSRLAAFARAHGLSSVKVSVPEEKAYLFQTDVPSVDLRSIEQNIEFKLEENVPLSAADAVFCFDLLPAPAAGAPLRASVSVVPRSYVERYSRILKESGLDPISFETVPKAVARAVIPVGADGTRLIIHAMERTTGLYVVSGNAVRFAFTAGWGVPERPGQDGVSVVDELGKEVDRIRAFWFSHGDGKDIGEAVIVGKRAPALEALLDGSSRSASIAIRLGDVWTNSVDIEKHLPDISRVESLEYAVAAGLAFDTPRAS